MNHDEPAVEELTARAATLELERDHAMRERDEALAERDQARRDAEATERRVITALAGDLAGLARRARAEYADRLARGDGARFEHLLHHAKAFEYVAVELAGKFGGEVAEAIIPPEPPAPAAPEPSSAAPDPVMEGSSSPLVTRRGMIEID